MRLIESVHLLLYVPYAYKYPLRDCSYRDTKYMAVDTCI